MTWTRICYILTIIPHLFLISQLCFSLLPIYSVLFDIVWNGTNIFRLTVIRYHTFGPNEIQITAPRIAS